MGEILPVGFHSVSFFLDEMTLCVVLSVDWVGERSHVGMKATDAVLLERWAAERDAEAFREIVSRPCGEGVWDVFADSGEPGGRGRRFAEMFY